MARGRRSTRRGVESVVYFLENVDTGAIKIGYTTLLNQRIADIQSVYGIRLRLLATIPGGYDEEVQLHEQFHNHRLKRRRGGQFSEWFAPAPELLDYIATVHVEC